MKYLIAACIFLLCCSFISFRFVENAQGSWILYIYPTSTDTTTYISHLYFPQKDHMERKNNGKWENVINNYNIVENVVIHGETKKETEYYFHQDRKGGTETIYNGDSILFTHYFQSSDFNKIKLNDSLSFEISYRKNGMVFECKLENYKRLNPDVLMVCDSLNTTFWIGYSHIVPHSSDTIKYRFNYNTLEEDEIIVTIDSSARVGPWKKYNRAGKVIDSMFYK